MNCFWAGLIAAALIWQINNRVVAQWGNQSTTWVTPWVEETVKTLSAVIFKADIVFTHGIFGGVEALYDLFTSRRRGLSAALISLIGHVIFGIITKTVVSLAQSLAAGIFAGAFLHLAWNVFVGYIVNIRLKL